jgi:hypothetical protein
VDCEVRFFTINHYPFVHEISYGIAYLDYDLDCDATEVMDNITLSTISWPWHVYLEYHTKEC